jgi:uncharacterized membrane protein YkvA (DUF1232 family)
MPWFYLTLTAISGLVLAVLLCLLTIRCLGRREPYAGFVRLRNRRKLTFFRLLLQDQRVPLYIKVVPLLIAVYIVSPIDLLPGIPLDDIALALLALVLIVRLTPRHVLEDLLHQAAAADVPAPPTGATPARARNGSCDH